jgi:cation-transporting P-type ATPase E
VTEDGEPILSSTPPGQNDVDEEIACFGFESSPSDPVAKASFMRRDHQIDSSFVGLTQDEVAERHAGFGGNRQKRRASRSYSRILGQNLFSFLNLLIFSIAAALAVLAQYVDAAITLSLAVTNVGIATIQEYRAKRQLDRIALLARQPATVIRDGTERPVEIEDVVRDDLLVLRTGEQVVVDGVILSSSSISLDESLLSGESEHVLKTKGDTLYSGSFCMTGMAIYQATAVGADSVAEMLSTQARKFRNVRTPLQSEITWMMRFLLIVLLLMSVQVLNTINQLYARFPVEEAARASAVIVGLVPQGLVLMVVVTYAMAIVRLSGRGVLIQRMNAVESMSHVDMLCLDKTGTITTNNLQLEALIPIAGNEQDVRDTLGDFVASVSSGNRTTDAIGRVLNGKQRALLSELPFSSAYKWSGVHFQDSERTGSYLLGAPETFVQHVPEYDQLTEKLGALARQGKRVLLFTRTSEVVDLGSERHPNMPDNLAVLAIVVLSEELRSDAQTTIQQFAEAGIGIKLISGDNPETVAALARHAGYGLDSEITAISGLDLEDLTDKEFFEAAKHATVFGRVNPQQKERLISMLKAQGFYVAMVGDGVNDVLAMKQAHVAVAMRTGSEITRSVADLVLIDDSFAVLPDTFREGQRVRNGMQYTMELFLSRTFYTMIVIYVTAVMGDMFPVALRHSALVAALTVGIPAFALAIWAQPGKTPNRLLPQVFRIVMPAAITIGALLLVVYQFFLTLTGDILEAQTALTATAMLCGLIYIVFLQPPTTAWVGAHEQVRDRRPTMLALAMLVLYMTVALVQPLKEFFDLRTLPISAYLLILFAVTGWAVTLRLIWRLGIADKVGIALGCVWRGVLRVARLPRRRQATTL